MLRPFAALLIAAVAIAMIVTDARAQVTAENVRLAIDRGVAYLRQQQKPDGSWPLATTLRRSNKGGGTALATLAMLNSGVKPSDPQMQVALAYLRKIPPERTYVVSLQTMVFCVAEPKKDLLLINRNVKRLEQTQITKGDFAGAWAYPGVGPGDNSNSQFALLALHEAERVGVEVSPRTWRLARAYWERAQRVDGSWNYKLPRYGSGTGSMTCAGIAALVITSGKVGQGDAKVNGEQILCCQPSAIDDVRVQRGLQWLGRNFSVARNPGGAIAGQWWLYYLYGVERVGRLTAQRFIGGHDWYREGADQLIRRQDNLSGYWTAPGYAENQPEVATSLALLFLSKGRRPPLIAKLRHGADDDDWDQHHNDIANLTRFVESRWHLDMTWQVMDLEKATIDDLLQAPVLYYDGSKSPMPTTAQGRRRLADKIRGYLNRGGFLFVEAGCDGAAFDRGFRDLMQRVFPEPEYALRPIEPGHPIWRAEIPLRPAQFRPLWGIDFGCRTSVVYAPPDPIVHPRPSLSCLWELSRAGRGAKYVASVEEQVAGALAIGINVLAYATNRELKGKEAYFDTQEKRPDDDALERGRLSIAKIRHPGGCNAAPRSLVNLLETAGQQLNIRVSTEENLIYLTDEALYDHHLIFMHGRNRFRLTDVERERLRLFIERGGILFADAICANAGFAESFRREMAAIFPDKKLQPIAVDDPLLTTAYGGFDLKVVKRRDPQMGDVTGPLQARVREVPPSLEGIQFGDQWRVIFSRFDISCALEKHESLDCRGYVREDATRIGLNLILYALQH